MSRINVPVRPLTVCSLNDSLHINKQLRLKKWNLSCIHLRSKECYIKANIKNGNMVFEAEKSNCGNVSKMLLNLNSSEIWNNQQDG